MKNILFYITGHGFGHAIPMIEVMNKLKYLYPEVNFYINTTVPQWLFKQCLSAEFEYIYCYNDVGVIQKDYFSVNKIETIKKYAGLIKQKKNFLHQQINFTKKNNIKVIVGNIPPVAFDISNKTSIPGIAIGNFSWDWIYEPYIKECPEYQYVLDEIRESYSKCNLLLRVPFHGDMSIFPVIEDIPLIARKSNANREEIISTIKLNNPKNKKIILISLGGLDFELNFVKKIKMLRNYFFIYPGKNNVQLSKNILTLSKNRGILHHDLIKISDLVITKPGYGIVSESIANQKPVMYTSRDDFREYDALVSGIKKHGHSYFIPRKDFITGNWENYINKFFTTKHKWHNMKINGAEIASRKILSYLS